MPEQEDTKMNHENDIEESGPTDFETFLKYPELRQAIVEIPKQLKEYADKKLAATQVSIKQVLIWAAVLLFVIVVPVSVLAGLGKFSSDAAAFLYGAIVGAAFTFIRQFISSRN